MWGWQPEPSDCQRVPQRFEFDVNYAKFYYGFKRYRIISKVNNIIQTTSFMIKSIVLLGAILCSILIIPIANAQQFEKASFQETATLIYDQKLSNSILVSIGFETTNNNEMKFSDELIEKINSNEKIRSIVFTNVGECVIGVTTEQQCIMINFDYEELKGDGGIRMVQESARMMGDELIEDLNNVFRTDTTFHSTFIHVGNEANLLLETSGVISGRGSVSATYVTDKNATDFLFTDLAGILIPKEIREGEGFYDVSQILSKHNDSNISISLIPSEEKNFYIFKVTKEIKNTDLDVELINVLENFGVEKLSRSNYFNNKMVPLNSVIQLIVIPEENRQVKAISTHMITDLTKIENILNKGWFMSSPAGNMIDLRFLFGDSKTVIAEELRVETSPWDMNSEVTIYAVGDIVNEQAEKEKIIDSNEEDSAQYIVLGIIIAIGIGAAIFYLKGYKPKH